MTEETQEFVSPIEPFARVTIQPDETVFILQTPQDFISWIDEEREVWDQLNGARSVIWSDSAVREHIETFVQARKLIDSFLREDPPQRAEQYRRQVNNLLNEYMNNPNKWITSYSYSGGLLKELVDANRFQETAGVIWRQRQTLYPKNLDLPFETVSGALLGERVDSSFDVLPTATKRRLTKVFADTAKAIDSARDQAEAFTANMKKSQEAFDKWTAVEMAKHEESIETRSEEYKSLVKLFKEEMATKAATDYWEAKRRTHAINATKYSKVFWCMLSIGSILLIILSFILIYTDTSTELAPSITSGVKRIATIGLSVTFLAWGLRVVSRLMMSERHQAADAEDRRVLVMTYFSMLQAEESPIDKEHRALCLQAIFRQGSAGLVEGDAIPANQVNINSTKL